MIDGRLSEDHETSFAEIDGPSRSELLVEGRAPKEEQPNLALSSTLTVGDKATVRELEQRIATASVALKRARTTTETAAASAGDDDASYVDIEQESATELEDASVNWPPYRSAQFRRTNTEPCSKKPSHMRRAGF